MDEKTQKKVSLMESVLVKMEDLENSQQSLIGKIGQIEVELFDLNSPDLDKELAKVIDRASETLDMINSAKTEFEAKHDAIVKKNSPPKEFYQHNGGQPDQPDFLVKPCSQCFTNTQYDGLSGFTVQVSFNAFKKCFGLHGFLLSCAKCNDAVSMPNVP